MKNKLIILSVVLLGLATIANAANKDRWYAEKGSHNFFVSLGGGIQFCVNPDNSDYGLGKAVTGQFQLSVGKLINPVWGVRLQGSILNTKLNSDYINGDNGTFVNLKQKYVALRADAMFNISNAISGYNPDRVFDAYAFMGPSLTITKATIAKERKTAALVGGTVGLGGKFNVSKSFDIYVEARGEVAQSPFGDYSSSIADGNVAVTAGLTYYFGGKKFVKVTNMALLDAANGDIKKYKELLAQEQDAHNVTKAELEKEKKNIKVQEVVKVVETESAGDRAIFFTIGSARIDSKGKVNIKLAAELMKANTDVKYVVYGYADKATGSVKTNQKLSEKRAQAVVDELVKNGVSADQVEAKGMGGQENMFENSRALTRVVIIERAK
ncbi:MAG: OmpA family protein [Bacteroidales bacterium]|jgi:outer membrane protein OmpA-like peptidoglycan-associated protein|nr:OmpA family protein [Bacteroidales bacterium]MBQ1929146.1 OmpA family protein [Bacteroidales bacterium]MBQ5784107.1 OmpA family protein [Bacteroidales bacterium]MBQ5864971.1 OmpA family protein [Bacteroidales bacterium]